MFVRKKKTGSGTYLYLVENVRSGSKTRQRVVAYLGPADMGLRALGQKLSELRRSGAIPKGEKIAVPKSLRAVPKLLKAAAPLESALPDALEPEIYSIVRVLKAKKLGFLVGGMTAVNAYLGHLRASQDLDVFLVSKQSPGEVSYALRDSGYVRKVKRMAEFVPLFSRKHPELTASIVDVMPYGVFHVKLDEKSMAHSVKVRFRGLGLRGLSIEEIMLMKASRVERGQDEVDIQLIKLAMEKQGLEPDWDFLEERAEDWNKRAQLTKIRGVWGTAARFK